MLPFTGDVNNRAVDIRQTLDTAGDHQLSVAYQQNMITDTSAHAAALEFLEFLDLRQLFPACTYDCACNRMLRKLLGCCGKCQTVLFGELLRGINLFNLQIAGGHCAGLVEYDQTQVCSPFHRFAALHVNAFALKSAAAAYKSKRYSQRQCGRTAGDEKRQSAIYPAGHIRTGHEQRRKCGCQYGNDDHNRNQALGITLRTVFQRCLVFGSCILYSANLTNRAVLVARDHRLPASTRVFLSTAIGTFSPVSTLSSTVPSPRSTTPSIGTRSPECTRTSSPRRISASGT